MGIIHLRVAWLEGQGSEVLVVNVGIQKISVALRDPLC